MTLRRAAGFCFVLGSVSGATGCSFSPASSPPIPDEAPLVGVVEQAGANAGDAAGDEVLVVATEASASCEDGDASRPPPPPAPPVCPSSTPDVAAASGPAWSAAALPAGTTFDAAPVLTRKGCEFINARALVTVSGPPTVAGFFVKRDAPNDVCTEPKGYLPIGEYVHLGSAAPARPFVLFADGANDLIFGYQAVFTAPFGVSSAFQLDPVDGRVLRTASFAVGNLAPGFAGITKMSLDGCRLVIEGTNPGTTQVFPGALGVGTSFRAEYDGFMGAGPQLTMGATRAYRF